MILQNKYVKAMEHIQITTEMADKMLDNISRDCHSGNQKKPLRDVFPKFHIKTMIAMAASFMIILIGSIYVYHENVVVIQPPVQALPSIQVYDTLGELQEVVDFDMKYPSFLPNDMKAMKYTWISLSIGEIRYENSKGETLSYRISKTTKDISGVYTDYPVVTQVENILLQGDEKAYYLGEWQEGDYSFSIYSSQGFSQEVMMELIASI